MDQRESGQPHEDETSGYAPRNTPIYAEEYGDLSPFCGAPWLKKSSGTGKRREPTKKPVSLLRPHKQRQCRLILGFGIERAQPFGLGGTEKSLV
jgi:hypothetical protein